MFLRSKTATVGACIYLLTFLCATVYAYFDRGSFSGLPAVLLTWPLIDFFPLSVPNIVAVPLCAVLNAVLIYVLISVFSKFVSGHFRRRT
jgi:hypothetical protein